MALLTAQLLFVERLDERTLRIDVIVLERAETPVSPPVGAGIAFDFRIPATEPNPDQVADQFELWCDHASTIGLSLIEDEGAIQVAVASAGRTVTLAPTDSAA